MFSKIGVTELLIVLAIALLIFGPKALPKLGKSIGQTIGNFKKGQKEADAEDEDENVVKAEKVEKAAAKNDKDVDA